MSYSERDRSSIISYIVFLNRELEALATPVIKAELSDLPEHIERIEKTALTFITKLRVLKPNPPDI